MKLIITTVDNTDVGKVMSALTDQRIGVTRVSSTGGFIDPGNSTLLIGIDEARVPQAMKIIAELAATRQSHVPHVYAGSITHTGITEIQVGGYLSFVLDVVHFEQV